MEGGAGAPPRRARAAHRRAASCREGRPRPAGDAGERQDPAGRPGRGAGDDRHLRLRPRALAAALRADHGFRTSRPRHARDLAPHGRLRRDHLVQLPRSPVVLERGPCARMRRSRAVEALGEDAAHGARDAETLRAGAGRLRRCAGGAGAGHRRREGCRRAAGGEPRCGDPVGHRLDTDGTCGGGQDRRALRPHHPGARRQQRDDRGPLGRSGPGASGHRLRGRGHGRPALHLASPPHRPRERLRRTRSRTGTGIRGLARGRPARRRHARGPLDRRGGLHRHGERARAGEGRRRHGSRRRPGARRRLPRRLLRSARRSWRCRTRRRS